MTHSRHLRQRFRHARRPGLWQRIGKLPVVSAAALGAATLATVPATQSSTATAAHADRPTVLAGQGHSLLDRVAPANAATRAGATPEGADKVAAKETEAKKAEVKKAEAEKPKKAVPADLELYYQYGVQTTPWYCGPAATRMALSSRGLYPSQDDLARRLGTTVDGTNSSVEIARVLNDMTKSSFYQATSIPSKNVSKQQVDQLRADVVEAVSNGYPVVTNIVGSGTDLAGVTRTFDGGHYIAVVGYRDHGRQVKIGDSADPNSASYWMDTAELAHWAGGRGYAA
ncbi:MAG: C39 family peptidase [Micromonosporaceae bacterium]|jgi:hypothetical protein|nr:C39 family peptidase [Micromonosporaceae bacterium]